MAFACNIDRRGKRVRVVTGLVLMVLGLMVLFFHVIPQGGMARWTVTVAMLASGTFIFFEGAVGWCVVRAMGFKTRM